MHSWPLESSEPRSAPNDSQADPSALQDGFPSQLPRGHALPDSPGPDLPPSDVAGSVSDAMPTGVIQLDEQHRGLSGNSGSANEANEAGKNIAGQRIIEYENSAMTPSAVTQALGFKVIKRVDGCNDSTHLTDLPNGA